MNQKNIQKMNKLIGQRLDNLDELKIEKSVLDDEERKRNIHEIKELSVLVLSSEQHQQKIKSDAERSALEQQKFNFEKEKFEEEIAMKREELKLKDKECDIKLAELKQNRTKMIFGFSIDMLVKSLASFLGIRAQLWDYKGYKIESSWSKESRNNLMK